MIRHRVFQGLALITALMFAIGVTIRGQSIQAGVSIVIDGAVNPELIPPESAWLHFIRALDVSPYGGVTQGEMIRRAYLNAHFGTQCADSISGEAKLSVNSIESLVKIVDSSLRLDAERAAAVPKSSGAGGLGTTLSMLSDRDAMLVASFQRELRRGLAESGFLSVEAHVLGHVRRHMRIVRATMPNKAVPAENRASH